MVPKGILPEMATDLASLAIFDAKGPRNGCCFDQNGSFREVVAFKDRSGKHP
jgi:hypothetical protein